MFLAAVTAVSPVVAVAQEVIDNEVAPRTVEEAARAAEGGPRDGMIRLQLPENAPLSVLITYVMTRLNLNIIYDEDQVNQRITVRTPAEIPESSLLDLLDAVLQARNLLLQDTAVPNTKRIVPAQQLSEVANVRDPAEAAAGAVTQVFALEHAQAERVQGMIATFITKPGGNVAVIPESQMVVVTDYASNMRRIGEILEMIDTPRGEPQVRPIPLEHSNAEALLRIVQPSIQALARAEGDPRMAQSVMVTADPRTNQLIVVGLPQQVQQVETLVKGLDSPSAMVQRIYRPTQLTADRLDKVIQQTLIPEPTKQSYRAVADLKSGQLVVTASPAMHEQIESLLEQLDAPRPSEQQPLRIYELKNTVAEDVLATIEALQGRGGSRGGSRSNRSRGRFDDGGFFGSSRGGGLFDDDNGFDRGGRDDYDNGDDFGSGGIGFPQLQDQAQMINPDTGEVIGPMMVDPIDPVPAVPLDAGDDTVIDNAGTLVFRGSGQRQRAVVAADENTNSIIVIAPPDEQRIFEEIIKRLDRRRPQVLIEISIVTLDTSDDFELGVDIGVNGDNGRIISFSSFGISDLDPETGRLTPIDATGGTLALLDPDIADLVLRALASNSRSRLVSMPRILVNDNERAQLKSVDKEPFQRTVVTDDTTIVGEGDTAEAGTRIMVRPHISDGDYLQLSYAVELSSFTADRLPNLPPPSQENQVSSRVTVPDGHTIVVGGLNRSDYRETINKVPLLGDIPLIKHIFQSQSKNTDNTTLFVFIRPTIMRDDQFRDLKHISGIDREAAGLPDDFPKSEPLIMQPEP